MALVLTQSSPRPASKLMYSFLKPVPKQRQDSEKTPDQYNGDSNRHPSPDHRQHDAQNIDRVVIHANANHDSIDNGVCFVFKSDDDRRKRRKIIVEGESHNGQENREIDGSNIDIIANNDRKVDDLSLPTIKDGPTFNEKPVQPTSTAFKKPRGRPPKSTTSPKLVISVGKRASSTEKNQDGTTRVKTRSPKTLQVSEQNLVTINSVGWLSPRNPKTKHVTPPQAPKRATTKEGGRKMTLKNGKFTKSQVVVLKYLPGCSSEGSIGARIQSALSGLGKGKLQNNANEVLFQPSPEAKNEGKTTHPFFMGRRKQQLPSSITNRPVLADEDHEAHNHNVSENKNPVAWKDIVFKSKQPLSHKGVQLQKAPWPATSYQHIRGNEEGLPALPIVIQSQAEKKNKTKATLITETEDILKIFGRHLSSTTRSQDTVHLPQRLYTSRRNALSKWTVNLDRLSGIPAIETAQRAATVAYSAFDRAEASGSLSWTQQYAPATCMEVLQPSCHLLYDWLKSLAVHTVKQTLDMAQSKRPTKRRKRLKKTDDDLLDFIISDDEQQTDSKKIKNAILIVGPNGCGKSAAVYAVAKQLGFEVFEIHPGMRRSQKDILDKVGDMAQNHMVQQGQTLSRDSSVARDVNNASGQDDYQQPSVASMFAQNNKKKALDVPKSNATSHTKQEQKQSLILFEEVDHLFEDDRGFWSGVQGLIQNSKRPVVLTCNTLPEISLEELDLHHILTFAAPPVEVVVPYLTLIATAEGHIIDAKAVEALYRTKNNDLRATITNLDFWCQMTVGSQKGGLDWYPSTHERAQTAAAEEGFRTFSVNTFQRGLDQLPTTLTNLKSELECAQECFNVPAESFFERLPIMSNSTSSEQAINVLSQMEYRSDSDLIASNAKQIMFVQLCGIEEGVSQAMGRDLLLQKLETSQDLTRRCINYDCLTPLAFERPVFPPSQGRLAPSLDLPRSVLAEEVAPYVRSIASFDQTLEQAREELSSSQGRKVRTTRAARAAAEGGDKGSTRRERWLPKDLDLQAVQATGNNWPQWHKGQTPFEDLTNSPLESADGSEEA